MLDWCLTALRTNACYKYLPLCFYARGLMLFYRNGFLWNAETGERKLLFEQYFTTIWYIRQIIKKFKSASIVALAINLAVISMGNYWYTKIEKFQMADSFFCRYVNVIDLGILYFLVIW